MTDSLAKEWIEENVTVGTWQTVAFGAAMLALGVWLGNTITGTLALAEWPALAPLAPESPRWIETVEQLNYAVLGLFAVGMLLVVSLDYMGKQRDSNDTDG